MEIQIFIEGGGNSSGQQRLLRLAFEEFFKEFRDLARSKRIPCRIIMGGSRHTTLSDYKRALKTHPNATNILLVDAEAIVEVPPKEHLAKRDNWELPFLDEQHCHLMVTMMEAWFLADRENLQQFFGAGFNEKALPGNRRVEEILKQDVESGLANSTKRSQKGEYHKMKHGPSLLRSLSPTKVRGAAPHCERFFQHVNGLLNR